MNKRKNDPLKNRERWFKKKAKLITEGRYEEYKEIARLRVRKSRFKNRKQRQAKSVERYQNDECFRIAHLTMIKMRRAIKDKTYNVYIEHLGMYAQEFRAYIQAQFKSWMNFSNYGAFNFNKKTWQFDHKSPLSRAAGDVEKLKQLLHFSNVRPLDSYTNICDRSK